QTGSPPGYSPASEDGASQLPVPPAVVFVGGAPPSAVPAAMLGPAVAANNSQEAWLTEHSSEFAAGARVPQESRFPLEAIWDNGLYFQSTDDQFKMHIGGVGQIDCVWLIGPQSLFAPVGGGSSSSNGVGNAQASLLRRAILQADGSIFNQVDFV